jgi:hypothetical protein
MALPVPGGGKGGIGGGIGIGGEIFISLAICCGAMAGLPSPRIGAGADGATSIVGA